MKRSRHRRPPSHGCQLQKNTTQSPSYTSTTLPAALLEQNAHDRPPARLGQCAQIAQLHILCEHIHIHITVAGADTIVLLSRRTCTRSIAHMLFCTDYAHKYCSITYLQVCLPFLHWWTRMIAMPWLVLWDK